MDRSALLNALSINKDGDQMATGKTLVSRATSSVGAMFQRSEVANLVRTTYSFVQRTRVPAMRIVDDVVNTGGAATVLNLCAIGVAKLLRKE